MGESCPAALHSPIPPGATTPGSAPTRGLSGSSCRDCGKRFASCSEPAHAPWRAWPRAHKGLGPLEPELGHSPPGRKTRGDYKEDHAIMILRREGLRLRVGKLFQTLLETRGHQSQADRSMLH